MEISQIYFNEDFYERYDVLGGEITHSDATVLGKKHHTEDGKYGKITLYNAVYLPKRGLFDLNVLFAKIYLFFKNA